MERQRISELLFHAECLPSAPSHACLALQRVAEGMGFREPCKQDVMKPLMAWMAFEGELGKINL